jgi:hypothetical protein
MWPPNGTLGAKTWEHSSASCSSRQPQIWDLENGTAFRIGKTRFARRGLISFRGLFKSTWQLINQS